MLMIASKADPARPIWTARPLYSFLLAIGLAIGIAGCGGNSATPSATLLWNPSEIVTRSLTALEAATTVHLDGTLSGSINATALSGLMGGGGLGLSGAINVNGATVTGDLDMSGPAAHITAVFPSLFATTVDVFLVDGFTYTKVNLFGSKYLKSQAQASASPGASSATDLTLAGAIDLLRLRLSSAISSSTLVGRDGVDGRDAYHVVVNVPSDVVSEAAGAIGGAAGGSLVVGLAPVDWWVYVDGLQPARLGLSATSSELGNLKMTLTLTGYGRPVQIQAPPASEVEPG